MSYIDLANELNDKQYIAASTIDGPVLIIAGAGSGKTRMITYRIAAMLQNNGIPDKQILALTFTNKAASEMQQRISKLASCSCKELTIATFHSFGVSVLRKQIHLLGYTNKFTIYDQGDKENAIKEAARESNLDIAALNIFDISQTFSNIKTFREEWTPATANYQKLYETYNDILKTYNAVDFDDLIVLPIKIFKTFPDVLATYQERFRYIMVDEFQDTSLTQYEFISLIAKKYQNICVVGDDDQSIYSWRGANYKNILLFEKDFPSRVEVMLEQNYRSSGNILAAANNVIANNTNRKNKKLWTPDEKGMSIKLLSPADEYEEAKNITSIISSLRLDSKVKYGDVGILVRTNSLIAAIEEQLLEDNLPYRVSGASSFFSRKEIKDVIAYLRLITNLRDEINLLRIINVPRRGIGLATVKKLKEISAARHIPLFESMRLVANMPEGEFQIAAAQRRSLLDFTELITSYEKRFSEEKRIDVLTQNLIDEINYWFHLIADNPKNEGLAKYKYTNVTKFIEMISRYISRPENKNTTLEQYLNRITLLTSDAADDEDDSKINLMTIHASKGLEFNTVFLAGIEDHIIPHARSIEENPENIQEERRLFYVAITRAKKRLYISTCQSRHRQNQPCAVMPSRFLEEIPKELLVSATTEEETKLELSTDDYFKMMLDRLNK